jgi:hypothetical protein
LEEGAEEEKVDTHGLKLQECDYICDNIYLGPEGSAIDLSYLKSLNISRILICASQCDPVFSSPNYGITYLKLDLVDVAEQSLEPFYAPAHAFIRSSPSNTLVHCRSGVSRSASLVISYLIQHYRLSAVDAYYYVKKRRPCVLPNLGFQRQLADYQRSLGITASPNGEDWEELINRTPRKLMRALKVSIEVPGYRRAQGGHVEYEVVSEGGRLWERYSRMRYLDKRLRGQRV